MDRYFSDFSEQDSVADCTEPAVIPKCINDDFCVASPMPRNNGVL